jgi:hypothetical protein
VTAGLISSGGFQLLAGIVGSGLFAGWLSYFVHRPKLRFVGGGGRAPANVRIGNEPRGLFLGATTIFGRRIHRAKTVGPIIETREARNLMAYLYEKGAKQPAARLFWESSDRRICDHLTLASRDWASLLIFERGTARHQYYVWQPDQNNPESVTPPPDPGAQYGGTHEFVVEVRGDHDRRLMRFPISMTLSADGGINFSCPIWGGMFSVPT